ncbi:MAG: hypothetical protein KDA92_22835, partial [Planctomycetales bacterium]|nr:hypothetical protein [Planctomycetales bacterium]
CDLANSEDDGSGGEIRCGDNLLRNRRPPPELPSQTACRMAVESRLWEGEQRVTHSGFIRQQAINTLTGKNAHGPQGTSIDCRRHLFDLRRGIRLGFFYQ